MRDGRALVTRVRKLEQDREPDPVRRDARLLAEFGTPPGRLAELAQEYRRRGQRWFFELLCVGEKVWVLGHRLLEFFPEWEGRSREDLEAAAEEERDEERKLVMRLVAGALSLRNREGKTCCAYGVDGKICGKPAARRDWWWIWVCGEHVRPEAGPTEAGEVN